MTRSCLHCGADISSMGPKAIYCRRRCADNYRHANNKNNARDTGIELECSRCGDTFHPFFGATRTNAFCSRKCYDEGRKEASAQRTHRRCFTCQQTKTLDNFRERYNNGKTAVTVSECKSCGATRNRDLHLRRNFGLSLADYEALVESQGGVCAICARPETIKGKSMAVDHDHTTGEVRGILCSTCNSGIGHLGDDPDRILAAAMYLIRASQRKSANA